MDNILSVSGQYWNFLNAFELKYPNSTFALVAILTKEMVRLYGILNFEVEPHFHLEDKVDSETASNDRSLSSSHGYCHVICYSRMFINLLQRKSINKVGREIR